MARCHCDRLERDVTQDARWRHRRSGGRKRTMALCRHRWRCTWCDFSVPEKQFPRQTTQYYIKVMLGWRLRWHEPEDPRPTRSPSQRPRRLTRARTPAPACCYWRRQVQTRCVVRWFWSLCWCARPATLRPTLRQSTEENKENTEIEAHKSKRKGRLVTL